MQIIIQDAIYSRADLIKMLEPLGLDADTFIARLQPRKVFKSVWLGSDLLAAFRNAPALSKGSERPPVHSRRRRKYNIKDAMKKASESL